MFILNYKYSDITFSHIPMPSFDYEEAKAEVFWINQIGMEPDKRWVTFIGSIEGHSTETLNTMLQSADFETRLLALEIIKQHQSQNEIITKKIIE